jgi:hypothetical protein
MASSATVVLLIVFTCSVYKYGRLGRNSQPWPEGPSCERFNALRETLSVITTTSTCDYNIFYDKIDPRPDIYDDYD